MRKLAVIIFALFALTANAFATGVVISSTSTAQIPFNPSGLQPTRTFTVTATAGSATVTSASLFPSGTNGIVGKSGFTVTIGGTYYTVAAVASTSSLTLTTAFTGTTGSTSLVLFPYVLLRAYPTASFQSSTQTSSTATVAVTNGSATVTSAALFPTMYTGVSGGYQVLINSTPYQVLWQASTSSLTLTTNYQGTSGAATITFDGLAENVQASAPGSGNWFKEVALSVVNTGSGNVLYYPSFVIPATTNGTIGAQAKYTFGFYPSTGGSVLSYYTCGSVSQLAIPATTPTTWTAICNYNAAGPPPPPPNTYYNTVQIDQRFPPCVAGQSYYFATNGNIVSCLNFGTNLTLVGNTLNATGGGGSGDHIIQGYNAVVDGGCDNTGATNATTCLNTAIITANAAGRQLFLPAGTYLANPTIAGLNTQRIFGEGPGRTIIQSAIGSSPVFFANNAAGLTHSLTIEELSLNGFGSGASDYGFQMSPDQPFDLTMRNVRITNVAKSGVYIPTNAFTMLFEGVDISVLPAGLNGFDIGGDNTITLIRTYVHAVGTTGAAYRLHNGRFTLLGCNGIDSGTTADWGVFGDNLAEDGRDQYARVNLIGSNVEAFTRTGLRAKAGSQISVHDVNFVSSVTGTLTAIQFDNNVGINPGIFDGLSAFNLVGAAAWTNGAPINSNGVPFLFEGVPSNTTYYDTGAGALINIGYRTNALNAGSGRSTQIFNRLAVSTGAGQGFDGNLPFIDDNTRTIGLSSSAGRPQHIYVGTGGVHVGTGAATVDGENWTITGGANPLLNLSDGTVAGRFQLTTGTAIQFGTTTFHPLNILTAGTNTWQWTSAGNLIALVGGLEIGAVGGNRPSAVYSRLFDAGESGTSAGVYIFRNATNLNTLTLQGGVTTTSYALTLPTAAPASTQCLQMSSTGAVTVTGSSCGSGSGTVSSVSVVSANGFAGSVATATTTPAITLSTTITGILSGNGTAISAASTTGSGNVVLATSPTLVTPALGTPTAIVLTSATGLPPTTGIVGWPANASGVLTNNGSGTLSWGAGGSALVVGTTTITGGTSTDALYNNGGVLGSRTVTGTGNSVLSASPTLTGTAVIASQTNSGTITQTSASATAFESGPNGGTNPVFRLVNSVASQASGISVTGNATGAAAGTVIAALDSGATSHIAVVPLGSAGRFIVRQPGGVVGTDELQIWDDGTQSRIESKQSLGLIINGTGIDPVLSIRYNNTDVANFRVSNFSISNASTLYWGTYSEGPTAGFNRPTSAVIRVNNGSTGAGALLLAPSTATVTGNFTVLPDNAATAAVVNVARIGVNSTGMAAAGLGASLSFGLESSTTNDQTAGSVAAVWNIATHTSRNSYISISAQNASAASEVARFQAVASSVNYFNLFPSATGQTLALAADGTDGNIGIDLEPKGTGVVTINTDPVATASNTLVFTAKSFAQTVLPSASLTYDLGSSSAYWRRDYVGQQFVDATLSVTSGNQTINKAAFRFVIAAGQTNAIITNSFVTTSSLVICTAQTNDTTMKALAAVPASGSVQIFGAAATADTTIACNVLNQ